MSAVAFQAFGFEDQLVRVLDRDGAPWFVAQDVCACLEITNHRDAVAGMDEDEKGVALTDTLGGKQSVAVVSESGVYVLIFRSRKPAAKRFRKWVTAEVLPTLRRTGSYAMPANDAEPVALPIETTGGYNDVDERRMMMAISVIKEARQVWGRKEAQQIWVHMGLPNPREAPAVHARAFVNKTCDVAQSIYDWMAACTRYEPDAWTASTLLYRSYTNWCEAHEVPAEHTTAFGLSLTTLGHVSRKNGTVSRRGLILI